MEPFWEYWGKATSADRGEARFHFLVYHSLDVAACAEALLARSARWRATFSSLTGLTESFAARLAPWFICLHDLGKFAAGFQNQRPDLRQELQGRCSAHTYAQRHDTLGYRIWQELLRDFYFPRSRLSRVSPVPVVDAWMRAVTGHHGSPPDDTRTGLLADSVDIDHDLTAAKAFVDASLDLFGFRGFPELSPETPREATWWLAGLTVLADWLGSNTRYFPYSDAPEPLPEYWARAQQRAAHAVADTRLGPLPPASRFRLADCFPSPPPDLRPTDLQRWATEVPVTSEPQLFILEDVTGSGKTEAALLLAERVLQASGEGGIYLALPTMATANGMYERITPVADRFFAADSRPSLVLAHSQARYARGVQEQVMPEPATATGSAYADATESAESRCSAWLSDSRKKALLAQIGVGTIDQALLAILPSRHQCLRLWGLMDKVLIVDEVHACDAYMNQLLRTLLEWHAFAGGTAILLSATLPDNQRASLIESFATGAGYTLDEDAGENQTYPLATVIGERGVQRYPVQTRPELAREVRVSFTDDETAVEAALQRVVSAGQCACWVRNTVQDARETFEELRTRYPSWDIQLFHARFTITDRLAIEQDVLKRYGKTSTSVDRAGRILIATQVVEQSLDLDFDFLVTDLAPIDLLIQRAGRLHRHRRLVNGDPTDGEDGRGVPQILVLAPPWTAEPDENWLSARLPGTAAVYEKEDAHLWKAMQLLREGGGYRMPEDARSLIEGVYAADPFTDFPSGLQERAIEADALYRCQGSIAQYRTLTRESGYQKDGSWLNEEHAPTRLGEPTTTLWLAKRTEQGIVPFAAAGGEATAADWLRSSVTVMARDAAEEVAPPPDLAELWREARQQLPGRGKWGVATLMIPVQHGIWQGAVLDAQGRRRTLFYHSLTGLTIERTRKGAPR